MKEMLDLSLVNRKFSFDLVANLLFKLWLGNYRTRTNSSARTHMQGLNRLRYAFPFEVKSPQPHKHTHTCTKVKPS